MLALALALTLGTAEAVPLQLPQQGRLLDASGIPLEGAHQLGVALYAEAAGGEPLWSDTLDATLEAGHYTITLGAETPLEADLFDGAPRYLELSVDGGAPLPQRLPVLSVPYAVRAGYAATAGALAEPLDWSDIANAPEDADSLGALSCNDGEVPTWAGGAWDCASPTAGGVDASLISGTIDVDNLPVGGSAGTVAAGDHTHGFGQITGQVAMSQLPTGTSADSVALGDHTHGFSQLTGQAAFGQLPVGTTANTVAAGNHTHQLADLGGRLGNAQLPTDPAFQGGVQVGTTSATCNSAAYGTLRWADGSLQVCTDGGWTVIAGGRSGASAASAGASCKAIKDEFPSSADGVYWLDPDGPSGNAAFRGWCEMSFRGGGWLAVWNMMERPNNNTSAAAAMHASLIRNDVMAAPVAPDSTSDGIFTRSIPLADYKEVVYGWAPSATSDPTRFGTYTRPTGLAGQCYLDGYCGANVLVGNMEIQPTNQRRDIFTGNQPTYPHVGLGFSGQIIVWGYDLNNSSFGNWGNWYDLNACCNAGNTSDMQNSGWRYVILVR